MTAALLDPPGGANQPLPTTEQRQGEINRRWWIIERNLERRRKRGKGKRPSIATLRVCELNRLFYTRYRGNRLPDDDDGRDSVEIMVNHLVMLADPYSRISDWVRRCVPWLDAADAESLTARTIIRPKKWTADSLAKRLNLTSAERDRLNIRTVGAVDMDKEQRKRRRRERDRLAKQAKRRASGAKPRPQSISRTKPWLALGFSRSKWYADRRAASENEMSGQSGQFRRQYEASVTADEFVQTAPRSAALDGAQPWSGSPAFQQSPLEQPLEPNRLLGSSGKTPSRAAITPDWRLRNAESWAEIEQLRADILRTHAEREARKKSALGLSP